MIIKDGSPDVILSQWSESVRVGTTCVSEWIDTQ